jgi:hypothetical protein
MIARHNPNVRRGGAGTTFMAGLALAVAVAALFLALFHDPTGPITRMNWDPFSSGLGKYDYSSAAGAYKSNLRIQYSRDYRAATELDRQLGEKELKEALDTLEIKKAVDLQLPKKARPRLPLLPKIGGPADEKKPEEKKDEKMRQLVVLFLTYKEDGDAQYKVECMERHPGSGLWKRAYVDSYEVESVNKELAKEMREWPVTGETKP